MTMSSDSTSSDTHSSPPSSLGDRPSPYSSGKPFTLKRHVPAPPCGRDYEDGVVPKRDVPRNVPQLEWCLTHSPRPGTTDSQNTRQITLKTPIRTGDQCGAQIWLTNDGLVAKIYDPLYYHIFNPDWPSETFDVIAEADEDYSNEAAAYSSLKDTLLQSSIMPAYHGSWTAEISIEIADQEHFREVRMILVEHIKGISMLDVNPYLLTRKAKDNVMRKVIEANVDLRIAGVQHNDFEPRNIMIIVPSQHATVEDELPCSSLFEDPELGVCIIDFAISCVFALARQEGISAGFRNPLFFWAGRDIYCEYGWLPPTREEANDWMWETWGSGGKDGNYIMVERDTEDYYGRPIDPKD